MTVTPDYVQKVRAYLVQRGELAAQASEGPWVASGWSVLDGVECITDCGEDHFLAKSCNSHDAEHIAANDPQTVQADVAALVATIDLHSLTDCEVPKCKMHDEVCAFCGCEYPCPTVTALVAPFAELVGE